MRHMKTYAACNHCLHTFPKPVSARWTGDLTETNITDIFLKNHENFVIRAQKNRNVIYNGKTQNIMDVANKYKGNYRMDYMDKHGKKIELLLTNIGITEKKKLSLIVAKVYLMRWKIEEYFKFKKQIQLYNRGRYIRPLYVSSAYVSLSGIQPNHPAVLVFYHPSLHHHAIA